jgi:hypothetical protein
MVIVEKINWIDKEEREADVTITDGIYSVLCFSCSFNKDEKDIFDNMIYCFEAHDIAKSFESNPAIIKKSGFYEYMLTGELKSKEDKIVKIGELQIGISDANIPNDINKGDYIEFQVERLDLY